MATARKTEARRRETAAKIAALTLANACIFQEELARADARVDPLRKMLAHSDVHSSLADHWGFICEHINYVPIFRLAREVLIAMPGTSGTDAALRTLIRQALEIVSERAALRHDLMGRVFHLLLLEAKYLGTFYTSVPAATLLQKITLDPSRWDLDWSDTEAVRRLRVADLACGTGTLLMASSQSITDNFVRARARLPAGVSAEQLRTLHRQLIEDVLHGYDVLSSAVHLTASTLSLLAPEIAFHKMQLFSLPLGKMADDTIALGSIEYLDSGRIPVQLNIMGSAPKAGRAGVVTSAGDAASMAELPALDICVMNPPFVRSVNSNLLFGSYPEHRREMQQELSRRLNGRDEVLATATAGLGAVFAAVGDRHLKQNGRMALVLPAAITTGGAWLKTRTLFDSRYQLEVVVASHDPERWAFSENTDLSEVLFVARKRLGSELPSTTQEHCAFLNLWRNPTSTAEAVALADSLAQASAARVNHGNTLDHGTSAITIGDTKWGELLEIPLSEVRTSPWLGCAFAQTDLVRANWLLRRGKLSVPGARSAADVPICELGMLVDLGPDGRDVHDGFETGTTRTAYPALWNHDADANRKMRQPPNLYLTPRAKPAAGRPARPASLLWPRAGRGMLAVRLRFNTQRLIATRVTEPALSNVWYPVLRKNISEDAEKALILWLNSTLGILSVAGHRVPTQGPWVQFKKPTWSGMPVLNVAALQPSAVRELAKAYDRLSRQELQPFPAMGNDLVRRNIDAEIKSVLGLPSIDKLRLLLAVEPVICNAPLSEARAEEAADSVPPEQLSLGLPMPPAKAATRGNKKKTAKKRR